MGFLNDLTPGLDWNNDESVPLDPNKVADGTHHAFVYDCKVVDLTAKGKGKSLVITYKMADDDQNAKVEKDEWRAIPVVTADGQFASDKDRTAATWLKRRLVSLGVPETKINDVDPKDLVGTEVYVTFKTKEQWQNVTDVKVATAEGTPSATTQSAASLSDIL
jgi:hypothetical protein